MKNCTPKLPRHIKTDFATTGRGNRAESGRRGAVSLPGRSETRVAYLKAGGHHPNRTVNRPFFEHGVFLSRRFFGSFYVFWSHFLVLPYNRRNGFSTLEKKGERRHNEAKRACNFGSNLREIF